MHFVAHSRFTAAAGAACLVVFASMAASAAPRRPLAAQPAATANAAALQQNIDVASLDHALLAAAIFHETNRVRAEFRLTPFAWLPEIDRAADLQANSTALSVTSGHGHLLPSLATPSDRAEYVGLRPRLLGENSALLPILQFDPAGYIVREEQGRKVWRHATSEQVVPPHSYRSFAAKIVDAWMNSPGHRANILNPGFTHLGCSGRHSRSVAGVDLLACVQVFYTPRKR